jgi:hypothetical protein
MSLVVVNTPELVVTPAQARALRVFSEADDDAYISMLLKAAQGSIDGPYGSLNRAVGHQELELTLPSFYSVGGCLIRLPLLTATGITSIKYGPLGDDEQTLDASSYELLANTVALRSGFAWPQARGARIRYRAGWTAVTLPEPIRVAIIMMAAQLKTIFGASSALRSETVEGVGRMDFALPDAAAEAIRKTAEGLLRTFKVPRV